MESGRRFRWRVVLAAVFVAAVFSIGKAPNDWRIRKSEETDIHVSKEMQGPQRQYSLTAKLREALSRPDQFLVYRTTADVPESVRLSFAETVHEKSFSMSQPDGPLQSDAIGPIPIPNRRLSEVAIGADLCLLFYQRGGFAESNHVAVFRTTKNRAEPIWHATISSYLVGGAAGLAKALKEGTYHENPYF